MASTMTAHDVKRALYRHFTPTWAVLTEVVARGKPWGPLGGKPMTIEELNAEREEHRPRIIDVLLLRTRKADARPVRQPSLVGAAVDNLGALFEVSTSADLDEPVNGNGGRYVERLAIEVKVSRTDFLSDVRNPLKQAPWRELAHRHAYAVPEGLVANTEVPADSGLIVVDKHRGCRFARNAPRAVGNDPGPLPLENQMDAWWRAARAEAALKGLDGDRNTAGDDETLRAEILRLRHELELTEKRADRLGDAVDLWRKRAAAAGPLPCRTCGKPLRYVRRAYDRWQHVDKADDETCTTLRTERAKAEHARFWDLHIGYPEPVETLGGE